MSVVLSSGMILNIEWRSRLLIKTPCSTIFSSKPNVSFTVYSYRFKIDTRNFADWKVRVFLRSNNKVLAFCKKALSKYRN